MGIKVDIVRLRDKMNKFLRQAKEFIEIDEPDIERVKNLKEFKFSDIDALHIALAEKLV